jgi:HTH-type transcriptional repressor of NAD biosynthesis genes
MSQSRSRPTRGLVIGKFLPPHLGHKYLIDFAQNFVDELTVLVCTLDKQPIPGRLRYEWMRRSFGGVQVIHHPDENPEEPPDADSPAQFWDIWRASILSYLDAPPDFVFASEPYGAELAEVLGARYIPGDLPRALVPISGTAIRGGLTLKWDYILPAVRPYFARRIAIIGPESSGKTTLAKHLAARFETRYAAEYARGYLDATQADITAEAFLTILRGHRASEDALAEQCSGLLFCDTEALTTKLWAQIFLDHVPPEVERGAAEDRYALYLVTTATEEWTSDPQRFFPEFSARAEFSRNCIDELERMGRRFVVLEGDRAQRTEQAATAVEALLNESDV